MSDRDIGVITSPDGATAESAPPSLPPCDHLARDTVEHLGAFVCCPACGWYWPADEVAKARREAKR